MLAVVASACSGRGGGAVPDPATGPSSYRVVYEIAESGGAKRIEERLVRRPYESRVRTIVDGSPVGGQLSNREGVFVFSASAGGWSPLQPGPQRAAPDPQPLLLARSTAASEHLVESGRAEHLGRPCVVLRTGADPSEPLRAPGPDDHVELCVDESGVVLSQTEVRAGAVRRSLRAIEFESSPRFAPGDFSADPRLPDPFGRSDKGYGERRDPRREGLRVRLRPPDGFAYDGWSGKLALSAGFGTPGGYSVVERFVRGTELLELDHSAALPRDASGATVEIEGLPRARLVVDLSVSRLVVPLRAGPLVELRAADPAIVLAAAEGLEVEEGLAAGSVRSGDTGTWPARDSTRSSAPAHCSPTAGRGRPSSTAACASASVSMR